MPESLGWYIVSGLLVAAGMAGILLPALPGALLIFAGMAIAAWADGFRYVGGGTLTLLAGLTLLTYVVDFLAGLLGVRRFGASGFAVAGAAVGTVAGLFLGLPGVLICPFLGAVAGELIAHRNIRQAGRAGIGTWLGMILGVAAKLAIAGIMLGVFGIMRFF
jgi:hypothetical protein